MKLLKTFTIAVVLVGLIILGVLLGLIIKDAREVVSNRNFNKIVTVTDKGFVYKKSENENYITVRDEKAVYEDIHKMANTKIIPEDGLVWGEDEIDVEKLNKVILEVMKSDFQDKETLLKALYNWKKGDYTHCVEEHNYVWQKLGGTVGKAKSLK